MADTGFVKVYSSILASSVWGESLATRVVWITMLAMADQEGMVHASSDGIARYANVPLKAVDQALAVLEAPDPRSKSQDFEGRRTERVDGGFQILNYPRFRESQTKKQKADAERQRLWREKKRDKSVMSQPVTTTSRTKNAPSRRVAAKAEAEAEAEAETTKATTSSDSGESGKKSWVSEGHTWWEANVGSYAPARFATALSGAVKSHGWPKVFPGLKCYVEECKAKGKPPKPEWYAGDLIRWIEWAAMPATDENGDLTPRGKAIAGVA